VVERTPLERFEELSTEIMQLLQVQINALDELDFAMTKAPDLRECAERGENVHQPERITSPAPATPAAGRSR